MSRKSQVTPPPVIWAQRSGQLFVTICLEDCKDPKIEIEAEQIYFKGVGGTERKEHEVTINLFKPIDPTKAVQNANGRLFAFILTKKEEGPYWPRLTKEDKKYHWLKVDFNRWKDEDDTESESEQSGNPRDLEKLMSDMSSLSGTGDGKPNLNEFDGICDNAEDSDDETMPELTD